MRCALMVMLISGCTRAIPLVGSDADLGVDGSIGQDASGNDALPCGQDPSADVHNCGSCGHDCTAELGSSAICKSGQCSSTTCKDSEVVCSGKCVDLKNDARNCGDCGNRCSQECVEGKCVSAPPKIDLLFMIDNSRSMAPKQERLRAMFPAIMKDLNGRNAAVSYHIGVVTSDLAAGPLTSMGGGSAPSGTSGCRMNGGVRGDGARLVNVGAAADPSCKRINGANYIDFDALHPANSNLPNGQDLTTTFDCMASVGETGCGMEHQLEAVYQALGPNAPSDNAGFLRNQALLVVVFVTDEDDCSAPDNTDLYAQDGYTLADGKKAFDELGYYHSFRCTEWGIKCNGKKVPRDQMMAMSGCQPLTQAEGGKLYDVDRYIDFFTQSTGVKSKPNQVVLASIAGPADQVETLFTSCDRQSGAYSVSQACHSPAQLNDNQCMANGAPNQMCSVVLQHACQPDDATRFGDPAVRISKVVRSLSSNSVEASICDDDNSTFVSSLGRTISSNVGQ